MKVKLTFIVHDDIIDLFWSLMDRICTKQQVYHQEETTLLLYIQFLPPYWCYKQLCLPVSFYEAFMLLLNTSKMFDQQLVDTSLASVEKLKPPQTYTEFWVSVRREACIYTDNRWMDSASKCTNICIWLFSQINQHVSSGRLIYNLVCCLYICIVHRAGKPLFFTKTI